MSTETTTYEAKWGPILAKAGYDQVPKGLRALATKHGLTRSQRDVLEALIGLYRDDDRELCPCQDWIATEIGCATVTVTRAVRVLRDKGLIRTSESTDRRGRYIHLAYDLRPLRAALEALAVQAAKPRAKAKPKAASAPKVSIAEINRNKRAEEVERQKIKARIAEGRNGISAVVARSLQATGSEQAAGLNEASP